MMTRKRRRNNVTHMFWGHSTCWLMIKRLNCQISEHVFEWAENLETFIDNIDWCCWFSVIFSEFSNFDATITGHINAYTFILCY